LFSEGDILPLYWLYDISNVALYYYDAFSDTQVYVLSKERFEEIVNENDLRDDLLRAITRRYTAVGMHINALQQTHAQSKIAQGLQYLVMSHGIKLPNGRYKVNMRLTQRDLASIVGVTRETTALELNKLKDKGVVSYQSFTYTVDYNALIRVTGSDEFGALIS
jgi:CRP-like cAMP-binding protein